MLSLGILPANQGSNHTPVINQLTHDIKLGYSKWSKDGKDIFALRNYGPYNQIYVINAVSGELKQVTNAP